MIGFPNCKINLGLFVTAKRGDGFHDIESVMYPVDWCDALEIIEHPEGKAFELQSSGLAVPGTQKENIISRAWDLLKKEYTLPPVFVHMLKKIPMGAGLGGGSSDAAFFLKLMNTKFALSVPDKKLHEIASALGSDCPFFLNNLPCLALGKGDLLSPFTVNLDNYYILIVYPGIHSNTATAYSRVKPGKPAMNIVDILSLPVDEWKYQLRNDFENSLFAEHPLLEKVKHTMYRNGAAYASMSGSGSAIYGIFAREPDTAAFSQHLWHLQMPLRKIL